MRMQKIDLVIKTRSDIALDFFKNYQTILNEIDRQQHLVSSFICLSNHENPLDVDRKRISNVSWIKEQGITCCERFLIFSFFSDSFSYQITMSLEIILLSLYLFVDMRIIIVKTKRETECEEKKIGDSKQTEYIDVIFTATGIFLLLSRSCRLKKRITSQQERKKKN